MMAISKDDALPCVEKIKRRSDTPTIGIRDGVPATTVSPSPSVINNPQDIDWGQKGDPNVVEAPATGGHTTLLVAYDERLIGELCDPTIASKLHPDDSPRPGDD